MLTYSPKQQPALLNRLQELANHSSVLVCEHVAVGHRADCWHDTPGMKYHRPDGTVGDSHLTIACGECADKLDAGTMVTLVEFRWDAWADILESQLVPIPTRGVGPQTVN